MNLSGIADKIRKLNKHPFTSAVIVAAGASERMQGIDKIKYMLAGKPVLIHSLEVFDKSEFIDEIVVVAKSEDIVEIAEMCERYSIEKLTKIVVGGATRQESSLAGLSEINEKAGFAAVHDGARPLVTEELIARLMYEAYLHDAAAPCTPVSDTVKRRDGDVVLGTPERAGLAAVQTPQCFRSELIKGALSYAVSEDRQYTDDCAAVEAMGVQVRLVDGDRENIKITTPLDLAIAEAIISEREKRQ